MEWAQIPARVGDPLEELLSGTRGDAAWLAGAVIAALCTHAGLALGLPRFARPGLPPREVTQTQIVEIDQPPPPPPPKVEVPVPPPGPAARPAAAKTAPPAAPAQAAAVITQKADPDEPLDLTNTFVTGSASTYAGGTTSRAGTNPNAVHGPTAPGGARTPVSAPVSLAGPDRSRRAAMAGEDEWRCPFPPEADTDQVDSAVVTVRVELDALGAPRRVVVLIDPGHGFGREAQRCALGKRWTPALDHGGTAIEGVVTIHVRFDR